MPKNNSKAMRDARRSAADKRQAQRDTRSPEQQIALLETRPGFANKETHRLLLASKKVRKPKAYVIDTPEGRTGGLL